MDLAGLTGPHQGKPQDQALRGPGLCRPRLGRTTQYGLNRAHEGLQETVGVDIGMIRLQNRGMDGRNGA